MLFQKYIMTLIETSDEKIIPKRNKYWRLIWLGSIAIIAGFSYLVYLLNEVLHTAPLLKIVVPIVNLIIIIGGYFAAKELVPGGYSHLKQAICHLGRIRTKKGYMNLPSSGIFALIFFLQSLNLMLLGAKMLQFAQGSWVWVILTVFCYMSVVCYLLTGISPIDLFENFHTNMGLASVFCSTAFVLFILYMLWVLGIAAPWMPVFAIIISIVIFFYMKGYIQDYRYTGSLQKIWLLFINISFVLLYLTL